MNSEKTKNKLIYFLALGSMCLALVLIMYNFFYKTVEVDVMKNIELVYTGENGSASVTVENNTEDLNQRIQEFMETVEYEVSPNSNLSNGDTIHIIATYDDELSMTYHYQPINTEKEFIVQGLNNRFESKDDIPENYLNEILTESENYITEHADEIFNLDPETAPQEDVSLNNISQLYCAFLKSTQTSDRIISVYQLDYASKEQAVTIYYLVCVPNINDGNRVIRQDIYGETAYLSSEELQNLNIESYIHRVFGTQYSIEKIETSTNQDQNTEKQ
ncbi:hypothetical protein [Faecalitalea cylindroides]|uniref:hypothetical protein n=1 Tax=Faecalitalea cylindroides TaxID=39483 RepID=UPI0022E36105|nr:hypothetical protein [Faecalitalea cylindroides]